MIDFALPPLEFPKPAIVRPAPAELLRYGGDPVAVALQERQRRQGLVAGAPKATAKKEGPVAEPAYLTYATSASTQTTFTFSGLNFGPASADRHLIALCSGRNSTSRTLNAATIGGVSAAAPVFQPVSGSHAFVLIAPVPTGTSGSVVVTMSGSLLRLSLALYAVTGLLSTTPTDTASSTTSGSGLNLDIEAGGFAVGIAYATSDPTTGWTGLTQRVNRTTSQWTGNGAFSSAMDAFAAAEVNRTIGATMGEDRIAVAAAFR